MTLEDGEDDELPPRLVEALYNSVPTTTRATIAQLEDLKIEKVPITIVTGMLTLSPV